MKVVVINGKEIKGCTYNLKQMFLEELKPEEVVEYYLPKDGPDFCKGCKTCFMKGEHLCPHYEKVNRIWESMLDADLIVFAYPVYVLRTPGHVKTLLDHFGVHWCAHRPEPKIFSKSAAIITQSIGAPNRQAQKDVKTSLNWLGISHVKCIGFGMMEGVIWNEISLKRRNKFRKRIAKFASKFKNLKPRKLRMPSKLYFKLCKMMQNGLLKKTPDDEDLSLDVKHWIKNGWIKRK